MVFVSGQLGLIPGVCWLWCMRCCSASMYRGAQTKDFAGPGVEGQTEQVMRNMGAVLEAAGSDFSKVVKTTILLADMDDFATVNAVYGPRRTPWPLGPIRQLVHVVCAVIACYTQLPTTPTPR